MRILVSSILAQYSEEVHVPALNDVIVWRPFWTNTGTISHASISENVHSRVMYIYTNFDAFITK